MSPPLEAPAKSPKSSRSFAILLLGITTYSIYRVFCSVPLALHEVTSDDDFPKIVQCEWESYQEPLNTFFRLFRRDETPAGFTELHEQQLRYHKRDSISRWFKVVDTDLDDKIIGAANWNVLTENPYQDEKQRVIDAEWWPEGMPMCNVIVVSNKYRVTCELINTKLKCKIWGKGEKREFANKLYGCLLGQRFEKMAQPHVRRCNLCSTFFATRLRGN